MGSFSTFLIASLVFGDMAGPLSGRWQPEVATGPGIVTNGCTVRDESLLRPLRHLAGHSRGVPLLLPDQHYGRDLNLFFIQVVV